MSKSDIAQDEERRWTQPGNEDVQIIVVEKEEEIGQLCARLAAFKALISLTFDRIDANKIPLEKFCSMNSLRVLKIKHANGRSPDYTLPASITKMQQLTKLELKNVSPVGLEQVAQLTQLKSLTIANSDLTSLPVQFAELKKLRELLLLHAQLTAIPAFIFKLTSLTKLDLSHNKISGVIPSGLSQFTALTTLAMSSNELTSGLEILFPLSQLERIDLSYNKLSGVIPPELGLLSKLQHLCLGGNNLHGAVPASLGKLEQLTRLYLHENNLTGVEPGALGGPKIDDIVLSENKLTEFPSLQRLTRTAPIKAWKISLSRNPIPSGPIPLSYVTEVRFRDIYVTNQYTFQGFSVGHSPNETYFLEHTGNVPVDYFINTGLQGLSVVDFTTWSPTDYSELENELQDSIVNYPQMLIKYPKRSMKTVQGSPVAAANKIFPALRVFLRKLCEAQNPCVLNALCRLWYAFTFAAKLHRAEEDEMLSYADEIATITAQLFKCNALDDASTFYSLVLPKQYWRAIEDRYGGQDDAGNEKVWGLMHAFGDDCPIKLCMDFEFKQVLASPAVSTMMEFLFYNGINFADKIFVDERNHALRAKEGLEFTTLTDIDATFKAMSCPRYTPVVLFLLEGLSKAVVLLLVGWVTIGVYGKAGHSSFANSTAEGFLLLMLFTQLAYEMGQLSTVKWRLKKHMSDIWNTLDTVALMLISVWALLCCFPRQFDVARTLLSLSAIPLSLQMLQYISLVKEIGLLVLMIKSMIVDVMVFVLVYVVSIFGFGVCFYGMFYGDSPFDSSGATLLYLFQSTLGNFDFGALSGSTYNGIGTVVLVLFLVLTSVLLVNLLIAQMSSTYSRIKDKSREEWSFILASYVQEYILLRERTPLCLLPPPFNAITTVLAPLHYWALPKFKISIAGTVADYVLGMVLVPFRLVYLSVIRAEAALMGNLSRGETIVSVVSLLFMPIYMTVSALVRIFYVTVHVVPAPKSKSKLDGSEGSAEQQYNIWYFVDMQLEEHKVNNHLPEGSGKEQGEGETGGRETGDVELRSVKSMDDVEASESVRNVLLQSPGSKVATPEHSDRLDGDEAGVTNAVAGTSGSGATDKPLVFFTEDDIHRMFPAESHLRRHKSNDDDAGLLGTSTSATSADSAVLEEVLAQNERLRADMAAQVVQLQTMQAAQAAQAAAQAEMMAMMRKILSK